MAYIPPGCDVDDLLAELVAALQERRPPDPLAHEWLLRGIYALVRGESAGSLDVALGLTRNGAESTPGRVRRIKRDLHLVCALRDVVVDDSVSGWTRCARLAPLVRSFLANTWPRVRNLQEAPAGWPAWKREVFRAAQTGIALPATARGLHKALNEAPACFVHTRRATVLAQLL